MAIWLNKGNLISEISESTGFKSGLTFSFDKMLSFVTEEYKKILLSNKESVVRIRAEEYEELYLQVLKGTGYANKNYNPSGKLFSVYLLDKYGMNDIRFEIGLEVYKLYSDWLMNEVDKLVKVGAAHGTKIDPSSFFQMCKKKYGLQGAVLCGELLVQQGIAQDYSPWNKIRRVDWKDSADLKELFESESLKTFYGSFIDQRYIDYLANNFDDLGQIHWRKFEALTAEFFKKEGYYVEIGPGRSDGGVDVRVYKENVDKENPPLILIQCKRWKDQVQQETVKALWADVDYEKATSGLIVTSSTVAFGAKEVCSARGYNIDFAENDKLKQWIQGMSSTKNQIII